MAWLTSGLLWSVAWAMVAGICAGEGLIQMAFRREYAPVPVTYVPPPMPEPIFRKWEYSCNWITNKHGSMCMANQFENSGLCQGHKMEYAAEVERAMNSPIYLLLRDAA